MEPGKHKTYRINPVVLHSDHCQGQLKSGGKWKEGRKRERAEGSIGDCELG